MVRGDTLSAIAKEVRQRQQIPKAIFEANRPMPSHPDKDLPGQKLRIPPWPEPGGRESRQVCPRRPVSPMYKKLTRQQADWLRAAHAAHLGAHHRRPGDCRYRLRALTGAEAHSGPAPGVFAAPGAFPGEKWPIPAPTGHTSIDFGDPASFCACRSGDPFQVIK